MTGMQVEFESLAGKRIWIHRKEYIYPNAEQAELVTVMDVGPGAFRARWADNWADGTEKPDHFIPYHELCWWMVHVSPSIPKRADHAKQ